MDARLSGLKGPGEFMVRGCSGSVPVGAWLTSIPPSRGVVPGEGWGGIRLSDVSDSCLNAWELVFSSRRRLVDGSMSVLGGAEPEVGSEGKVAVSPEAGGEWVA